MTYRITLVSWDRIYFLAFVLGVCALIGCSQVTEIHYPSPAPTTVAIEFMPGVVCTDSLEFNGMFSPDGKEFYFSRYEEHDIYVSRFEDGHWGTPVVASFSHPSFKDCDPAFSPDGNRLYFISTRPRDEKDVTKDFDIWYVDRKEKGWTEPANLEIVNSDSSEYFVSVAGNGNLYFASARTGGYSSFDIYKSVFQSGEYTVPVNLGPGINDQHLDHDPWVSPDERFIIFTSVDRPAGLGRGDLYISRYREDQWTMAINLGPRVNTVLYEFAPCLTSDGKYLFFSRKDQIEWIATDGLAVGPDDNH